MKHLSLEIFDRQGNGSKYATLPEDVSITITDTSEIFASGDVWSYSFTINTRANAHIFGTSGEMHGSRLHEQVDRRRARLWVEGLPLYLGYLRLDDEVDVDEDGNVEVTFESGQKTFEEMIDGAKASQVPLMSDVMFGVALWRKRYVRFRMKLTASATTTSGDISVPKPVMHTPQPGVVPGDDDEEKTPFYGDGEFDTVQEYPRMVFPRGRFRNITTGEDDYSVDCLNTDYPYTEDENGTPSHPYCNVALCYQRYGYERTNERGEEYFDYGSEPEAQRGYEVMPADRVNSAPNFFVIYWLRSLMKHLGIHIEENQMMSVEDLRRLFLVNTRCAYEEPEHIRVAGYSGRMRRYMFKDSERLVPEYFGGTRTEGGVTLHDGLQTIVKPSACVFKVTGFKVSNLRPASESFVPEQTPSVRSVTVEAAEVVEMTSADKSDYVTKNSWLHDAYATSECFPDVDVSEVIKALESGFGIRFLFSDNYQRVRIVLMRNIFRSSDVQDIACDIISDTKQENCIRGFRMTYGNTEDSHFYYKGFADMLPHIKTLWADNSDKHDYSQWDLNAEYSSILNRVSAFNKTCYVTPNTGNAYGIKVDKDAKRYVDLHPSLFEFAGFMDAEDGDCTGEEETIDTVSVGFTPAIMNDLNWKEKKSGSKDSQRFALFVDEKMRPRRPSLQEDTDYNGSGTVYDVDRDLYAKDEDGNYRFKNMMSDDGIVKPGEFAIASDMPATVSNLRAEFDCYVYGHASGGHGTAPTKGRVIGDITDISIDGCVNDGYRLYLQDNFEPNDDGVSPVESHDWGLTLGIMRGSGSDARVEYKGDPDDLEGNDTWEIEPGSSVTAHPDTCDCYGNEWDYNGSVLVDSGDGAVSQLLQLFPDSNIDLIHSSGSTRRNAQTYISGAAVRSVTDSNGGKVALLFAITLGPNAETVLYRGTFRDFLNYAEKFNGMTRQEMRAFDASPDGWGLLVETDSSNERFHTMLELQRRAFYYGEEQKPEYIDNGIGSRYGRFSLKLRAEKPNPKFDPGREEGEDNRRYLAITNENLRGRGLADQFYKEYSYWVRNARIAKRTVRMELAQLLAIDKTVRVRVGDITGFIRKMQYSVSNQTGLGMVTMEILYI